jgi:Acetyltransferase (GNAT) domain
MKVERYSADRISDWDTFVSVAKNRHFMFLRGFTEYHSDRFEDHSLMFFNESAVVAVLPANALDGVLYSHQGLTYGGVLAGEDMTTGRMLEVFDAMRCYMAENRFVRLIYKPMPYIFHRLPSQEDLYALSAHKAALVRRDLSSVLDIPAGTRYTKGKKSNLSRARRSGVSVRATDDCATFSRLLSAVLKERHGLAPAHTEQEMELLHRRFPGRVRIYGAYLGDSMVAGSLIFDNAPVVHTQYLANSSEGREVGALDFLIHWLISEEYRSYKYLSFGISTEQGGMVLNQGLLESKESFGARAMTHDWYELTLE